MRAKLAGVSEPPYTEAPQWARRATKPAKLPGSESESFRPSTVCSRRRASSSAASVGRIVVSTTNASACASRGVATVMLTVLPCQPAPASSVPPRASACWASWVALSARPCTVAPLVRRLAVRLARPA